MILKQKYLSSERTVEFFDDKLRYSMRDGQDTFIFSVDYDEVNFSNPITSTGENNLSLLAVIAVCGGMVSRPIIEASSLQAISITAIMLCVIVGFYLYLRQPSKVTVFQTAKGSISLFVDKQLPAIENELRKRCKDYLKKTQGKFSYFASPQEQLQKFKNFFETGIINQEEYDENFGKICHVLRHYKLELDKEANPQEEMLKYQWMHENGIISAEELHNFTRQLEKAVSTDPFASVAKVFH